MFNRKPKPKGEPRHISQGELHLQLAAHNKGGACQCFECLWNKWYWKQQYGTAYPEAPAWAKMPGEDR